MTSTGMSLGETADIQLLKAVVEADPKYQKRLAQLKTEQTRIQNSKQEAAKFLAEANASIEAAKNKAAFILDEAHKQARSIREVAEAQAGKIVADAEALKKSAESDSEQAKTLLSETQRASEAFHAESKSQKEAWEKKVAESEATLQRRQQVLEQKFAEMTDATLKARKNSERATALVTRITQIIQEFSDDV